MSGGEWTGDFGAEGGIVGEDFCVVWKAEEFGWALISNPSRAM